MQNNVDTIKKAKQCVKKYKVGCIVLATCAVLGYAATAFWGNGTAIFLILDISVAILGGTVLFRKYILSVLNKELDAETFLSAVYIGKFDTSAAIYQLLGEYFCGHYSNVVAICEKKLNDPKTAGRSQYQYLTYLANVYFDIGDDENLSKVFAQYQNALSTESKEEKIRRRLPRMALYELYLRKDTEACEAWLQTPVSAPITRYHRIFCQGRLALVQGNTEQARGCFETLVKEVPQLNYGKLSAQALAKMEETNVDGSIKLLAIEEQPTEVSLYPATRGKWKKTIIICTFALIVILVVAKYMQLSYSENKDVQAYRENIRVLMEEDYDGVTVIDTFTLKNDEEIVDTMFICKTDTEIIVGALYTYSGESEWYYEKMTDVSIASLHDDRSPLWSCSFPSVTTNNQIESCFYTVKADVPAEYYHMSTFKIDGQPVYYVVTEIVTGVVIDVPNA